MAVDAEFEQTEKSISQKRLQCHDIMTRNVTVATGEMTVRAVAELMRAGDLGVLPVVEQTTDNAYGRLIGIVTDRDLAVRAIAAGRDAGTTLVREIMTGEVHTVRRDDFVFQAIRVMGDKQVRRVPVVSESGELEGILSLADIALEMEDEREIAEALEDISSGSAFWRKS